MESHGRASRAWHHAGAEDEVPARSQVRSSGAAAGPASKAVAEALAELRQLTGEPLFGEIDLAADEFVHAQELGVDAVRQLRQWSAEYQRVATDLEAAARCCRLAEREINERVDALLSEKNRRLAAQFRGIFRRARIGARTASPLPEPVLPGRPAGGPPGLPAGPPDADIAASALGPLEVRVAGRRVPRWTSMKARAVFQYLLVHQGRPTRRDVLMALQWPDHSHSSARNNLNVALYSLRNTLDGLGQGAQPVLYRDGCYILNPGLTWWIDRNEFLSAVEDARRAHREDRPEQVIGAYRKAIRLYRGPLFEDDGEGDWYLPEQRRLQDLYGRAVESLAEIHYRIGEMADAMQFGQLALSNDPCSEASHRLLMRCYASQHQQQLVSRQYRVCVAALRDELDVAPSDETTKLFRELV